MTSIAMNAISIDPKEPSMPASHPNGRCRCHTQIRYVPAMAQRYACESAASIARASSCRRLMEQIAHGQCRVCAAGVFAEVVKLSVRR